MKEIIHRLDKAFENRIRLGVMSILMVKQWVEFSELKTMLDVTDGNLASHISALEKKNFIEVKKRFIGKKPNTTFKATEEGRKAFDFHLNALEQLLNRGN
jgi:DNA-binding MarR family transcriptional regulator